ELEPLESLPRLRPRRRGAEDGDGAFERSALRGNGAGVVSGVGLLLVRGVVLLVDADHADVRERGEDGGPGADGDAGPTSENALALVASLGLGQAGMEQRHRVAEASAEAADRLRRECDLRDEDDRAAPGGERRLT